MCFLLKCLNVCSVHCSFGWNCFFIIIPFHFVLCDFYCVHLFLFLQEILSLSLFRREFFTLLSPLSFRRCFFFFFSSFICRFLVFGLSFTEKKEGNSSWMYQGDAAFKGWSGEWGGFAIGWRCSTILTRTLALAVAVVQLQPLLYFPFRFGIPLSFIL